ncbi:unnamed protein product [Brachionus calyciflorus]|uniref:Bardet-Biedl syndrome 7 protein n=1 Tax=Brachionus calyciflorus TaxID=104777 RepID=A0A813MAI7_9BILA|nr:unnamed protein product [Brachionus calyciflorus]
MFQLQLNRVDYCQVGTTGPKCMKLMPSLQKELQKVVVGDSSGVVQLFAIKQKEPLNIFKTLPSKRITRIELSGRFNEIYDRIFVSSLSTVTGYTKKGRPFFNFETNMTEPIKSMRVNGDNLCIAGSYVFNSYKNSVESAYYLCPDKINDLLLLPMASADSKITPILACNDRILRVLDDSIVIYETEVAGPPTTLSLYNKNGGLNGKEILYGTSDGKIGLIEMNIDEPLPKWELSNERRLGGISCIDSHDITNDGIMDLLVSREDGTIEVYGYDSMDNPELKFTYNGNEGVTSIQGGCVGSSGYDEIVVSTYNGWIFGLTTESFNKELGNLPATLTIDKDSSMKMNKLRDEIDKLQNHVIKMRDVYQSTLNNAHSLSQLKSFQINHRFELNRDDASYTLSIEAEVPIDNVLIQCDVPIDLLDSDKNSCVVSYSECDENDGNFLLVTYRCQANTTRLDIKIRTIEGQYGLLQAYVTSRIQPKNCLVKQYVIKPLSLHQRTHMIDEKRPINKLKLSGNFSLAEIHSWLHYCIPEIPEKVPAENEITFYFLNTFLGTQLEINYKQNEATFKSENVSTISILKDVLSKKATDKKVVLNIDLETTPESTTYTLKCIHPMIDYHITSLWNDY